MLILKTRRFSVSEYHRMVEAGILAPDDRLELLDGEIVEMSPIGREHAACVDRLTRIFVRLDEAVVQVRVQGPLRLDERSEVQPDLSLLRARSDGYADGHPEPEDALLLVEVSDTTLAYDRLKKAPAYASQGIQELWIVDLGTRTVEVHRDPAAAGFRSITTVSLGGVLQPSAFPGFAVSVDRVFGMGPKG